jgi:predicted DNA-binding transcriptional regulator YafY
VKLDNSACIADTACPMAGKELHSRTPLQRMVRIHTELVEGRYPNCSKLARSIEVSSKTIQRDLEYMRDQLGLPIEYAASEHGYHYTEAVTHFPTIPATEGEVLALFVAQKALEQYRGTPFEQPLAGAFEKLADVLQDSLEIDLGDLAQALSFRHTGAAVTDLETFKRVTEGLMEERELNFTYRKLGASRSERRKVQPYHLASIDGQWYLFAWDTAREDIRTFVLSRIQSTPTKGPAFSKAIDFSLSDHLMGSFGVFAGEGEHAVRIEFDDFAAQLIRERTWHPSQIVKELSGGRIQLSLQLDSLEEIERWVLSWGEHARVLAPRALQQRVRAALQKLQDAYPEMPPWFAELHDAARAHQPDRLLSLVMNLDRRGDAPGQMHLRIPDLN